jgi:general nucleoside transport system permease protein
LTDEVVSAQPGPPPVRQPETAEPSWAEQLAFAQRLGGLIPPFLTTVLAFFIGGLVVLFVTGRNPLPVYKAIFEGTGLNWFFPWVSGVERSTAASNLQFMLGTYTTPLLLTGLAVAFAFRCGLFNIGGQGQYIAGSLAGVWIGSSLAGLPSFVHIILALGLGALVGAAVAGIAGLLKATVGAHEVILTIMLNWIVYWFGLYLIGVGGPLQNSGSTESKSPDVVASAKLPVLWGFQDFQPLHAGLLIAIAALVAYWITLSRTTLGYEVRAVGFNPEAARYSGISVARNYFLAMAISGTFAGLAGAIDILGWQFRIGANDIQTSSIGFIGIAVALLGRNTAVGVGVSALLFGALLTGTSSRNLPPDIFNPALADNLTTVIQGLVVLFVGADILILLAWNAIRRERRAVGPT